MGWIKKGLIYRPDKNIPWRDNSALTPTPIILNNGEIRVYAGFRDKNGVSRIGYVDVDANNPSKIIKISEKPCLDIGNPGMFDDNGMILGDIVKRDERIFMYYVGFQLVQKVKFLAYTGLAISEDNGETFKRYSETPIMDRCDGERYIRSTHTVLFDNGIWKSWGGIGDGWEYINGNPYPQYNIRYYESKDGINFSKKGIVCVETEGKEYRIGRPRVYRENGKYIMYYTYGTTDGKYFTGYAESDDSINWIRKDEDFGLKLSEEGWDSIHLAYPSKISYMGKTYMFYNGNNMGFEGFGYAELEV